MIRHLLKMVWNRKRVNFFIILEIFFSFLVLFVVVTFGLYYADNYRQPLGFSYQNVWNVGISQYGNTLKEDKSGPLVTAQQIFLAVKELPEIEAVAGVDASPYGNSHGHTNLTINGRKTSYGFNAATDGFKDLMGMEVVRGRWFNAEDVAATNYRPVVINQRLSRDVFGDEDPIGKRLGDPPKVDANSTEWERLEMRVIGVISDFRQDGELAVPINYLFDRRSADLPRDRPPRNMLVKVRPGTTAVFEEKLVRRLQAVAKEWSFEIEPLSNMRETTFKVYLAPIIAAGSVAGFLMLMVALGLMGVLWQNVAQRTKEIGLRRAKGATARKIHLQILGELVVIASFGLALGLAIIIQFPLLDLISFISSKVYFSSLAISLVLIYLLTILCGLYPSWLATKVQPAEALHYE